VKQNQGKHVKLRTFASGLTHLLFTLLLLLSAVKAVQHQEPSDAAEPSQAPAQRAEKYGNEQVRTASMVDATQARPQRPDAVDSTTPEPDIKELGPKTGEPEATPQPLSRKQRLMQRLVTAYPDFLSGYQDNAIIWRDGTRMTFDDGREKTFQQRLTNPDLEDQFYAEYPRGLRGVPPLKNIDPGRVRYTPFFAKMYGNCKRNGAAVSDNLEDVVWLPNNYGKTLRVTTVNGVANALRKVSAALDKLPQRFMKYLHPSAGTYNCRAIAGTERLSMHAYGAAVDINAQYGDYWRWRGAGPDEPLVYRNRIPWEIVEIFEQHGFIWGGKWYHYDTLHFEYRPELLNAGRRPHAPMPEQRPHRQPQAER